MAKTVEALTILKAKKRRVLVRVQARIDEVTAHAACWRRGPIRRRVKRAARFVIPKPKIHLVRIRPRGANMLEWCGRGECVVKGIQP
jgi:hypothetical protein